MNKFGKSYKNIGTESAPVYQLIGGGTGNGTGGGISAAGTGGNGGEGSNFHIFRWKDMHVTQKQSGWQHQQWASPRYGIIDTTNGKIYGRYGGHQVDWYPWQDKIRIWGPNGYEGEAFSNGTANGNVDYPDSLSPHPDFGPSSITSSNSMSTWSAWTGPELFFMARNNSGVIEAYNELIAGTYEFWH